MSIPAAMGLVSPLFVLSLAAMPISLFLKILTLASYFVIQSMLAGSDEDIKTTGQ